MKQIFTAILLNFISILIFCIIYIFLKDDFIYNESDKINNLNNKIQIIDIIMYTSTIQSGVGLTNLMPNSFRAKFFTIMQQYVMISFNFFILYFFALI
jgi:hypothetical protein